MGVLLIISASCSLDRGVCTLAIILTIRCLESFKLFFLELTFLTTLLTLGFDNCFPEVKFF